MTDHLRHLAAGLRLLLGLTLVLGVGYPLAVYAVGRFVPDRADGSLVERDGTTVGSSLIGQSFGWSADSADPPGPEAARWFQARPSVAGDGYDALASAASNLGPENPDLLATVQARRMAVATFEGVAPGAVPADAVTASGSGLDPDISPAYARLQVARVAQARGLDPAEVAALVEQHVRGRTLGFLGDLRVNVLDLNLALDSLGS